MSLRRILTKITSIAMVLFSLYQIFLSMNAIFFIYPNLQPQGYEALVVQEGLIEKAIILYISMITNGIYGTILLFKPEEEVKFIHIIFGIIIFFVSLFFVTKTPFTSDPIIEYLMSLVFK